MIYFHTPDCGPSVDGFRNILAAAGQYAVAKGITSVVLAVHTMGNLDGIVSDVIGDKAVKLICKAPIHINSALQLGVMTERKPVPFRGNFILVATHTSTAYLLKLETLRECEALFLAPWHPDELADYLARHTSTPV